MRSGGHQYLSPPTKPHVRCARAVVLVPLCRRRTWRASSSSMRSVDLTENGHSAKAAVQPSGRADQHRPPLLVAHACWSLAEPHEPQRLNASSELICDPVVTPAPRPLEDHWVRVERAVFGDRRRCGRTCGGLEHVRWARGRGWQPGDSTHPFAKKHAVANRHRTESSPRDPSGHCGWPRNRVPTLRTTRSTSPFVNSRSSVQIRVSAPADHA